MVRRKLFAANFFFPPQLKWISPGPFSPFIKSLFSSDPNPQYTVLFPQRKCQLWGKMEMGQKIFYSGEMELTRGIGGFEPRGNRLLYGGNGVRRIHLKVEEMNLVRWRSFKSNATLVRFLGFLYTFWMLLD